ncbi:hypothetical protein [Catenulispora sp. GP43]|uniref:hypothetical protein n=1 Tax=Catenulispora sp. GP43 TaxID=3156263 RepID=UPI00351338EC
MPTSPLPRVRSQDTPKDAAAKRPGHTIAHLGDFHVPPQAPYVLSPRQLLHARRIDHHEESQRERMLGRRRERAEVVDLVDVDTHVGG